MQHAWKIRKIYLELWSSENLKRREKHRDFGADATNFKETECKGVVDWIKMARLCE
jgi:hypothetical protein